MIKNFTGLILALLIVLSTCSCASNVYQTGLDYDGYPESEIPVYPDAVVFSFTQAENSIAIKFGSDDGIEQIVNFYEEFFEAQNITVISEQVFFGAHEISGTDINGAKFSIQSYAAAKQLAKYYETVTEILIEYNGEGEAADSDISIAGALSCGILQNYFSGNADYDVARQNALNKINELTLALNKKNTEALSHTAALAQQLSGVWDKPRNETEWPVLYGLNSANLSYLKALGYIDGCGNDKLPPEIAQTARPLYALEAASAIQDSMAHLLTANAYYDMFAAQKNAAEKDKHWQGVLQIWEKAETVFEDMAKTAQQLSLLINEVVSIDKELGAGRLPELEQKYAMLKDTLKEYAEPEQAEKADAILNTFDVLLSLFNEELAAERSYGYISSVPAALNVQTIVLDGTWQNGAANGDAQSAADRLDAAVQAAEQPPEEISVRYSTSYNTEDAEIVIGMFIGMGLMDALDSPPPQPSAPDQTAKPVKLSFPSDTDNKAGAFKAAVNSTLKGAAERGYDKDFALSIMEQENNDAAQRRDIIDGFVGNYDLDLLVIGALEAAEKRNAASSSSFTGDEGLDALLAIMLTQASATAKTSSDINAGNIKDLPFKVKNAVGRLGDNTDIMSKISKDIPDSIEAEENADNALANLMDNGEKDNAQSTAKDSLAKSIKAQTKTVSSLAGAEQGDMLSQFENLTDIVKEIGRDFIAQSIGNTLDKVLDSLKKNPEKAINEAFETLIKQTAEIDGFESWNEFLAGLQNAINNTELFQAVMDALVSGDITDFLSIADFASNETAGDSDIDDNNTGNEDSDSEEAVDVTADDYTGTYTLSLKMIDHSFTVHPNDEQVTGFTDEEYSRYINEAIDELETADYNEDWRNPAGKIEILHDADKGTVFLASLGSQFQDVFILNEKERYYKINTKAHTIEFSGENEDGDYTQGKMTFDLGLDGTFFIEGSLTVFNSGGMADSQRTFEISGAECESDGGYVW